MSLRNTIRRPVFLGISSQHVSHVKTRQTYLANSSAPTPSQPLTSILIANRGEIALSVFIDSETSPYTKTY